MASAIEGADVILMCVSKNYKESSNCRAEAEYSFQRKVPIVPVMVESNYRPDGWLGFLLGSKLWYSAWDDSTTQSQLPSLLKDISKHCHPAPEVLASSAST